MKTSALLLLILVAGATWSQAQCLTASVGDNAVVSDPTLTLTGRAAGFGPLRFNVSGKSPGALPCVRIPGSTEVDRACAFDLMDGDRPWTAKVELDAETASLIQIERAGCDGPLLLLVTPAHVADIQKRPTARFQIDWSPEAADVIRGIGTDILGAALPAGFAEKVRSEAEKVCRRYLSQYDITIGSAEAPHKIFVIKDTDERAYARTSPRNTCGDQAAATRTEVYMGTIRKSIGSSDSWKIIKTGAPLVTLAEDLGHALGTIITHEVQHAAGLVECGWMQGDGDGHNDPRFERGRGHRYGSGTHLMDTFAMVPPNRMVGRSDPADTQRTDLPNDTFSANYLKLIHPKP